MRGFEPPAGVSVLRPGLGGAQTAGLRTADQRVRLAEIVETVDHAVFTTRPDGVVTTWNRGAERLYGYSAAEMVGADASILHRPGSAEPERVLAMIERGETVRAREAVRRTKDGGLVEVSVTVAPLRNASGEVTEAVVIARDLSDRRRREAELVRQTALADAMASRVSQAVDAPTRTDPPPLSRPGAVLSARERRNMTRELRDALARGHLDVDYQPVLDLADERVTGLEALVRWYHPTHGPIPPGTFVPLAEEQGLVAELDRWVLRRACSEVAKRRRSGRLPADARVAVNLSARTLGDPHLVDLVRDVTRQSGLAPTALVLEITETAVLQDLAIARRSLEGLRTLGAGVSLDDFGTGYSSLTFLRELPVTAVKIDRSFIRHLADRAEDLAITRSIIGLAHGLGLETVAEGVETADQLRVLRRLGCGEAQGYWWSPAVGIDQAARYAEQRERVRRTAPVRKGRGRRRGLDPALTG